MTKEITKIDPDILSSVMLKGDVSGLNSTQKIQYVNALCGRLGLDPVTRPFDITTMNGKQVIYANKGCAEQLRQVRQVSIDSVQTKTEGDLFVVTANASTKERKDSDIGVVNVKGLFGEKLANATMKAITKAKRRVTLSICGLNMLDQTEVESVQFTNPHTQKQIMAPTNEKTYDAPPIQERLIDMKDPGGFVITFGKKYKDQAIRDIDPEELADYVYYMESMIKDSGKPAGAKLKTFFEACLCLEKENAAREQMQGSDDRFNEEFAPPVA